MGFSSSRATECAKPFMLSQWLRKLFISVRNVHLDNYAAQKAAVLSDTNWSKFSLSTIRNSEWSIQSAWHFAVPGTQNHRGKIQLII
jgi:hypothetical protein